MDPRPIRGHGRHGLLILDNFDFHLASARGPKRCRQLSESLRELRDLSIELNMSVLIASQLADVYLQREDKGSDDLALEAKILLSDCSSTIHLPVPEITLDPVRECHVNVIRGGKFHFIKLGFDSATQRSF